MEEQSNSKKGTIISWIFSIICFMALPVYGFNLGIALMLVLGVFAIPIKPIRGLWNKIPIRKKWFKPVILVILYITAIFLVPQEAIDEASKKDDITVEATNEDSTSLDKNDDDSSSETTFKRETSSKEDESEDETTAEQETTTKKEEETTKLQVSTDTTITLDDIPAYSGNPYVAINDNVPYFNDAELSTTSYEFYSDLDSLGRCGVTYACIGKDIMPTEERGSIGQVKPTGWHTVKYDIVDGKYLYNRCHLIGYQLTGENANTKNLITGTRSMNVDGMLPFENMVADYVTETGNHVMYRVTPMFEGDNLLASGVLMEAKSVEDNGEGILFNVFVYNVQEGIAIDYATGDSELKEEPATEEPTTQESTTEKVTEPATEAPTPKPTQAPTISNNSNDTSLVWISETGSKYHSINNCGRMNPDKAYQMTKTEALNQGYSACSKCH